MAKYLLIILLILIDVTNCANRRSEIYRAIDRKTDFSKLTPAQLVLYASQKNDCDMDFGAPIEHAAWCSNVSAVKWLVKQPDIDLSGTRALKCAFAPCVAGAYELNIFEILLPRQWHFRFMVDDFTPLNYLHSELAILDHYPRLRNSQQVQKLKQVICLVDRFERPLRWIWINMALKGSELAGHESATSCPKICSIERLEE